MSQPLRQAELRLEEVLGLSPHLARRAVAEVVDCFDRSVDEYISEVHRELQRSGADNELIYQRIAQALPTLRFRGPALTPRQVRRRIYG